MKKTCPTCASNSTIKWGVQSGKQRFKCKACGQLFCLHNLSVKYKNRFIWFYKWIIERQTFKTLSRDSKLSKDTLQKLFYYWLDSAPVTPIIRNQYMNLRVDATYFKRFCVVSYQDNGLNYTQLFRFSDGKHYWEIKEDLENLLKLENSIASITCDGHKSTLKAIREVMPNVKLQRCLVHIQRMCILWITKRPQSESGRELLVLVYQLMKIKTHNDQRDWLRRFYKWKSNYKDFLSQRTYYPSGRYGYTHKLLRRSFILIHRALPDMFHFLDDSKIPHTTNGIEGSFSHLKNHLDVHRGLTVKHRMAFIKWYIYFTNSKYKY